MKKQLWVLTFTRADSAGRAIGRYSSRDDSMLAAQEHFDRLTEGNRGGDKEEIGWQMSFASATAVTAVGIYRVMRADLPGRG